MNRYEVILADGYGRELDRLEVRAANLRLALLVSERLLCRRSSGHGQAAVSASVELLGEYVCEVDESAGQEELHSVGLHAGLHQAQEAAMGAVEAALDRDEFGRGLGEIDGGGE